MRLFSKRRSGALFVATILLVSVATIVLLRTRGEKPVRDYDVAVFSIVAPSNRGELRRATTLRIAVSTGTCHPGDPAAIARELNAPLRVEIQDRREAVVIKGRLDSDFVKSISPPEPEGDSICLGVGLTFERDIALPRPIGHRALINGGFIYQGALPRVLIRSEIPAHRRLWRHRTDRLRYMGIDRNGHHLSD